MVCSKKIHLKDQLWIDIAGLLFVLIFADLFHPLDFNNIKLRKISKVE